MKSEATEGFVHDDERRPTVLRRRDRRGAPERPVLRTRLVEPSGLQDDLDVGPGVLGEVRLEGDPAAVGLAIRRVHEMREHGRLAPVMAHVHHELDGALALVAARDPRGEDEVAVRGHVGDEAEAARRRGGQGGAYDVADTLGPADVSPHLALVQPPGRGLSEARPVGANEVDALRPLRAGRSHDHARRADAHAAHPSLG